ncbi:MAG: repeat domain protein [Acidimicrobiaceae bacterium]|nr:repeat domain protein [Acidimicrobiaceae bacterium]
MDGLASPYKFGELLPSIYQEDEFTMRWISAFDDVLAPVVSVLDNVESYFDPALAPLDFVDWLASWVGVELDETWPEGAKRELVAHAVELFRIRGTIEGLARHVAIYTGAEPEIRESGGCSWSLEANSDLPGNVRPSLVVRVRVADVSTVDERRLDRIVLASKPAHVPHRVEVLQT